MRILIVDDTLEELGIASDIFTSRGDPELEIVAASSPTVALAILAEQEVDIALVDYEMPEMTGDEMIQRIKTQWPHLPCILMSHSNMSIITKNSGAEANFMKWGESLDDLPELVARLLEKN